MAGDRYPNVSSDTWYSGTSNDTSTSWGGGPGWMYEQWKGYPRASHTHVFEDDDGCSKPEKKKEDNMRGLYRIIVVNPKTEEIGDPILVIARDDGAAMVKAALKGAIKGKVEDLDILVDRLGDVRAKKDVQKVKVVEGDEE